MSPLQVINNSDRYSLKLISAFEKTNYNLSYNRFSKEFTVTPKKKEKTPDPNDRVVKEEQKVTEIFLKARLKPEVLVFEYEDKEALKFKILSKEDASKKHVLAITEFASGDKIQSVTNPFFAYKSAGETEGTFISIVLKKEEKKK